MLKESLIKSHTEVMIIGIKQKNGKIIINPSSNHTIQEDEVLFGLGHHSDFDQLRKMLDENSS